MTDGFFSTRRAFMRKMRWDADKRKREERKRDARLLREALAERNRAMYGEEKNEKLKLRNGPFELEDQEREPANPRKDYDEEKNNLKLYRNGPF